MDTPEICASFFEGRLLKQMETFDLSTEEGVMIIVRILRF